jgi:hypothetical protein
MSASGKRQSDGMSTLWMSPSTDNAEKIKKDEQTQTITKWFWSNIGD